MVLLEGGDDAGDEAVDGEDEDDGADDAVDEPHRADVEMGAHLVDKEGDDGPPQQRSQHNRGIAEDDVIPPVLGQWEVESREQGDNQEHDERVAQGEQETCDHVPPLVVTRVDALLDLADGVVNDHVDGIDNQDDAAHNLQDIDMIGDKIGHERDAQPNKQAIEQIACRSPNTCEKARVTAIVKGTLDAQDAYRSHGCRQEDTYRHTTNQYGYEGTQYRRLFS